MVRWKSACAASISAPTTISRSLSRSPNSKRARVRCCAAVMVWRHRSRNAAHAAFDRTLEFSLRSIRDGVRLRDGRIEVDLPYLALEMFESNGGGNIYYQIREEHGRVVTGYPDLPETKKVPAEPYSVQFYDDVFRGRPLRIAMRRLPVHDVPSAQTRVVLVRVGETIEQRQALAREILTGSLQQEIL